MTTIRLGIMGFGRIGRQLYRLAAVDPVFEIVAISDIGRPSILHHLLTHEKGSELEVELEGNYLVCEGVKTRLMCTDQPAEIPWDLFQVDAIIDATSRFRAYDELEPHLKNGAHRVLMSSLPESDIDRVIIMGVNEADAESGDRIVSAGSATTTAMAVTLNVLSKKFEIAHATMTSVHAYSSDQSLQDYAGPDYRRSRSGAENIIPNDSHSPEWVARVLPELAGKVSGYTLNVPVQTGSMLDLSVSFVDATVSVDAVNAVMKSAGEARPAIVQVIEDPIVSSDVQGIDQSVLFDLRGTLKAGARIVKMLIWYESLGHAKRILELAALYSKLDTGSIREAG